MRIEPGKRQPWLRDAEARADECWRALELRYYPSNLATWAVLSGGIKIVEREQAARGSNTPHFGAMLSNLGKGMGMRTAIEGFTGHITNSHTGNGAAGPLDSLIDVIAPVLERFSGKSADPDLVKAAVAEALKEHEKTSVIAAPVE